MAISQAFSGTSTISTTEWSLTTNTSGPDAETTQGVFQVFINLSNLAAGDVFEWKLYEKVLSSDSQILLTSASFAGASGEPGWPSPTLILMHGWDMTLKKITGTDRSITWSIRRVG